MNHSPESVIPDTDRDIELERSFYGHTGGTSIAACPVVSEFTDDIDQLKAILLTLQAKHQQQEYTIDKLTQTVDAQSEEVVELKYQIQHLVEQLNLSKSKCFASQSEKIVKGSFNEAEQQDLLPKEKKKPESGGAKRERKPLSDRLEREISQHMLNAPYCNFCDTPLHECGIEIGSFEF